jgi:L-alanine-DL-glutamate epimerase-like enolase superfamily enzyme
VFVYAAGGYYYPGKGLSMLRGEMRGYLDRGYNVVKMKIGGAPIAEDRMRIEAVLEEIGSQAQLAVDANGRFDLETAIAYAKMLRDYPLFWYEEAGDPLDFQLQAALAEFYPGPMATGENLFSHQDARNLIRYGGMRPGCSSIARCPMGSANICARLPYCKRRAGPRADASRMAAIRCR